MQDFWIAYRLRKEDPLSNSVYREVHNSLSSIQHGLTKMAWAEGEDLFFKKYIYQNKTQFVNLLKEIEAK